MGATICIIIFFLLMFGSITISIGSDNKEKKKRKQKIGEKYDETTALRLQNGEVWSGMSLDQFSDAVPNCIQGKDESGRMYYRLDRSENRAYFYFDEKYCLSHVKVN